MSYEQAIADLQTQAGLLLDLPQQIADAANQKINALTATYNANQNAMFATCYINQVTGSDGNPGTEASPYKTLTRALAATPVGGICEARLMSNYHIDADIVLRNRGLRLVSSDTNRRTLTFERRTVVIGPNTYRTINNFRILDRGNFYGSALEIVIPPTDGLWSSYTQYITNNVFMADHYTNVLAVALSDVQINRPATPFCPLLWGSVPIAFNVNMVVETGSPMTGYWLSTQQNTAGVATNSLANILTDLTTI